MGILTTKGFSVLRPDFLAEASWLIIFLSSSHAPTAVPCSLGSEAR